MEEIKYRLGEYKYDFFTKLQNYLNNELIFFGSIKRADYFKNASDIDIAIITDNASSLLPKIKSYLNIKNSSIKKIYQKFTEKSSIVITGYKIKYEDKENNLIFDLLIYDEKYKNIVMENINEINNFPLYIIVTLSILKFIYYNLLLMSKETYLYLKNSIFYMYFNKKLGIYNKKLITTISVDYF
jgi:predicted nucleotidyltransferase